MRVAAVDTIRWAAESLSPDYAAALEMLVREAEQDPAVRALVLTGSLARRDALPGTDIDVRTLVDGDAPRSTFSRSELHGVEVEHTRLTMASAYDDLDRRPMHLYAWLDGCALVDRDGDAAALHDEAQERFDDFRVPEDDRVALRASLAHPEGKLRVALAADDAARAGFVASTCAWELIEGLWAANGRPVPPNSSVRPHLGDLDGPAGLAATFDRLVLGDALTRGRAALDLIGWVRERLAPPR